jgi:plastocyanin
VKTRTWTATITGTGEIGTIPAIPGDTIEWVNVVGEVQHFVSIWVPDDRVFGKQAVATGQGLPFSATILDTVPQGTPGIPRVYEYVIYDHTTGRFVEGKSHPKIEIPKP